MSVTWTTTNITADEKLLLVLYRDRQDYPVMDVAVISNNGLYEYTVPTYLQTAPDYFFVISLLPSREIYDRSNDFGISGPSAPLSGIQHTRDCGVALLPSYCEPLAKCTGFTCGRATGLLLRVPGLAQIYDLTLQLYQLAGQTMANLTLTASQLPSTDGQSNIHVNSVFPVSLTAPLHVLDGMTLRLSSFEYVNETLYGDISLDLFTCPTCFSRPLAPSFQLRTLPVPAATDPTGDAGSTPVDGTYQGSSNDKPATATVDQPSRVGVIVGGIAGGIAAVALIGTIAWRIAKCRRRTLSASPSTPI